jgi:hypothetical protein
MASSRIVRWGTEAALSNPALFQQADFRQILPNYFIGDEDRARGRTLVRGGRQRPR